MNQFVFDRLKDASKHITNNQIMFIFCMKYRKALLSQIESLEFRANHANQMKITKKTYGRFVSVN